MRFLITLFLLGLVKASNTVKDCSAGTSAFTFQSGSFLPDPVVPGQNATLTLSALAPEGTYVKDGTCVYGTTCNGIPFPSSKVPLCGEVLCPLVAGPYTNSSTSVFPSGVSGKIVSKIQWYDEQNTELLCVEITTRV